MLRRYCISGLLLVWTSSVFSFGVTGHRLVSEIALQRMSSTTEQSVIRVLSRLVTRSPDNTQFFLNCRFANDNEHIVSIMSTWADWLRYEDGLRGCSLPIKPAIGFFDNWHYQDTPICLDNSTIPNCSKIPAMNTQGAGVNVLRKQILLLKDRQGFNDFKSLALAFLIHGVADIHQPLHAATLFHNEYGFTLPKGDIGGNRFKVSWNDNSYSLHQLWDSVFYNYPNGISQHELRKEAKKLIAEFCVSTPIIEPATWYSESVQLAANEVYRFKGQPLRPEQHLNNDYVDNAMQRSRQRIAQAGCRLAAVLDSIYDPSRE